MNGSSIPLCPIRDSTMIGSEVSIRLGWKLMVVENTLAYYNTATITLFFIVHAPVASVENFKQTNWLMKL